MSISLTPTQIRQALERSGYLMEQRIVPVLGRHGYFVTPNHEYEDPDTGKSREIDIHALNLVSLYRRDYDDLLTSTILASCKNNHLPFVLFTHANMLRGVDAAMSIPKTGFPLEVERSGSSDSIETFLRLGNYHHYYSVHRVASQYCRLKETKQGKNVDYMADHGDLHDDLDSLIKAVNAEILEYKPLPSYLNSLNLKEEEDDINLVLIYPVIIFAGEMYECRQTKQGVIIRASNHIVFVRRVKSRVIKGEFFVDFVRESYLNRYLTVIQREFETIEKRLRSNRKLLRKNVMREMRALAESTTTRV